MSGPYQDPELERQLDTAFQASRPRRGFEEELWNKLRRRRSLSGRVWAGLGRLTLAPALAGVGVLLLVAGFVFVLGHAGGARSSATSGVANNPARQSGPGALSQGLAGPGSAADQALVPVPALPRRVTTDYTGSLDLTVSASLPALPAKLPVYRYTEPSSAAAAEFARSNGAPAPVPSPGGSLSNVLGVYSGAAGELTVLGTDPVNLVGPTYIVNTRPVPASSPPLASPLALSDAQALQNANSYLGGTNNLPSATPTVRNNGASGAQVLYPSQFEVTGFGRADQVDAQGRPVSTQVSLRGDGQVFQASGPLPLSTFSSAYGKRSSAQVQSDVRAASASGGTAAQARLTSARLVYVAVPGQGAGYFEPAWLLSGSFQAGGAAHQVSVLVAAVDTSQAR